MKRKEKLGHLWSITLRASIFVGCLYVLGNYIEDPVSLIFALIAIIGWGCLTAIALRRLIKAKQR